MIETKRTHGSVKTSEHVKRLYAQQSLVYNIQNPFVCELFPQYLLYVELHTKRVKERQEEANKKNQAIRSSSSSSIEFTTAIGGSGPHRRRNHNANANAFHGIVTTLAGLVAGVSILVAMRFM